MKTYFEVVKEFLDKDKNTIDFVVLDGDYNGETYEDARKFAETISLSDEDGYCAISVWESDEQGNLLESWLVRIQ